MCVAILAPMPVVQLRESSNRQVLPGVRETARGGGGQIAAGTDAGSPIQVNAETADSLDGERKMATFLFADIKGSMDLIEDLDPEEARAIFDPALKLMMEAFHHYGGYVTCNLRTIHQLLNRLAKVRRIAGKVETFEGALA
jgi:class 3 adenylate cyclase